MRQGGRETRERGGCDDEESGAGEGVLNKERKLERLLRLSTECSRKQKEADSTSRSSQAVPHPSTNQALSCLTAEVRRDLVHSTRYGRQR